ncbi:MAG: heparan-alpha-glucosaminide N-acetyltransferase domain-containing protein [Bacteroidales bacterium]|nr:heparan-alpha-glucosaminide N-acetyltransferase domain-containing protein [Bacteroidales bacterium]
MTLNKRNITFDVLKGIAVLLMIQVHIFELFASPEILHSALGKVSLFLGAAPVAPVFMLAFGYFIAKSKKSSYQLLKRGLMILGLGFFLNVSLNLNLIISVFVGRFDYDLLPYIFGVDILQLAGLSILIIALLKNYFEKYPVFLTVFIIICAFMGSYLPAFKPENIVLKYVLSFLYGASEWSYFPLCPWLSYPLLGMLFLQLQTYLQTKVKYNFATAGISFAVFVFFLFFTRSFSVTITSNLPLYYHHGLIFFLWTVTFMALYTFTIDGISNALSHTKFLCILQWFGKNVTLLYVVQWIIIGNIATEIYKSVNYKIYLFLAFIAILALSSLISAGILRLKKKNI